MPNCFARDIDKPIYKPAIFSSSVVSSLVFYCSWGLSPRWKSPITMFARECRPFASTEESSYDSTIPPLEAHMIFPLLHIHVFYGRCASVSLGDSSAENIEENIAVHTSTLKKARHYGDKSFCFIMQFDQWHIRPVILLRNGLYLSVCELSAIWKSKS